MSFAYSWFDLVIYRNAIVNAGLKEFDNNKNDDNMINGIAQEDAKH